MQVKIYSLTDPITGQIRYIGKTISLLKTRLYNHIYDAKNNKYKAHRHNWINSLLTRNVQPIIEELEIVDIDNWEFNEKYWIAQMKCWGFKLTNSTDGGDDIPHNCTMRGRHHSARSKQKIAIANTGKTASTETRKKQSDIKIGKPLSDEHKNNLFKAYGDDWHKIHTNITGGWLNIKNHTDDAKKKMSDAKIGRSAWNKGIKATDETKKKMSESKIGKPSTFKGLAHSNEAKQKISVAGKGRIPWNKKSK